MEIIVVSGYCLKENISANLSHNSFIKGLINNGHNVDIICYSEENIITDSGIIPPNVVNKYQYNGVSLYEKMAKRSHLTQVQIKKNNDTYIYKSQIHKRSNLKTSLLSKMKKGIRRLYGIYNPSVVWFFNAKGFQSNKQYDFAISMSYPQVSHLLCGYLIKQNKLRVKKWIQLWEDPWSASLGNGDNINKCRKEELRLLNAADDIVYVTPITLMHQQELFPQNKNKMRWCPLASYYFSEIIDYSNMKTNHYGYFGDYAPSIRNLKPFYQVAVEKNLLVDICGSPSNLFQSNKNVKIYPRLPLNELKSHEDKVNVAVCLFNLGGGQIPGKIYQLAATNKIILCILDGPKDEQRIILDYFECFNRFLFCQNNFESISEAIDRIENNDLDGVSNEPIDCFSVEKVAKMLLGD